jgi:3-isopropylmalate dehydrogenase
MPGDGIGASVLPEALRVLDAVGFEADYVHGDIGWEFWRTEGNPLPDRTIKLLEEHKLGLFGAITSRPKKEAAADLAPHLRDEGYVYFSPIVGMRQRFGLDICIRPCQSFAGNPLNFIRQTADGGFEEPAVDVVIFRQNTEGLYCGIEWTDPPEEVRKALALHPKFAAFADVPSKDLAMSVRLFTRRACRRIVESAFTYAEKHGYKSVTVCEKPNVLRETSGMMEEVAREVHANHPDIQLWSTNIDAQMMWLTKNPEDYGVLVAGNLFGDIVSDAFAGLVPSIVNPIAMILSAAMLLDHVGEEERGRRVRQAVAEVVSEGRVRPYDMMKIPGGPDSIRRGAATTRETTDAILEKLGQLEPA